MSGGQSLDELAPDGPHRVRGDPLRLDGAAAKTTVQADDPWTEPTHEPESSCFAAC